jgi:hypothetical protein
LTVPSADCDDWAPGVLTSVPPLPASVGDGLTVGDGLASGVGVGDGEAGEGLVVLPALPEGVPVPSGRALVAHGEGDGAAVDVRLALAVPEAAGEVVVRLGLGSGSGFGEAVCVGVSDGLVAVSEGDPPVAVSDGDAGVVASVAGLVVTVAGEVVGGVVVAVAAGLVVAFGWSAAPGGLHEATPDARAPGLAVTAPGPPPVRWPDPSVVAPPPLEFWPVIVSLTVALNWLIAARTGGTASATPRANTAKPAANAGRSTATCHRLAGRRARRAWPPGWDRRRCRPARNPPRAVSGSCACPWTELGTILARIRSRPSTCGSTWSAAACSAWRTKSGNSCPCACGPFGRRPNLTITPAPGPNAARSFRVRCGS